MADKLVPVKIMLRHVLPGAVSAAGKEVTITWDTEYPAFAYEDVPGLAIFKLDGFWFVQHIDSGHCLAGHTITFRWKVKADAARGLAGLRGLADWTLDDDALLRSMTPEALAKIDVLLQGVQ